MTSLFRSTIARLGAAVLAVGSGSFLAPVANAHAHVDDCDELRIPVALEPGGPEDHEIAATLCGPRDSSTVQVLLHGSTYRRYYFNFPLGSQRYSYVKRATNAGFATLNVDRLGYGESSHPPSGEVTFETSAFVVHQLVTKLRAGELGQFEHVVTVSHSMGSLVAFHEAAEYHDVDGVIATGMTHFAAGRDVPRLIEAVYPAVEDPKFADTGLDMGYTTTRPGTRGVFYYRRTTAPAVLALDEKLKDTSIVTEAIQLGAWRAEPPESNLTSQITAPVLFVVGAEDGISCNADAGLDCRSERAVYNFEAPYFAAAESFDVLVLQATGHNLNLHRTAPSWFSEAQEWVQDL